MNLLEKWRVVNELLAFVKEKKLWLLTPAFIIIILMILVMFFIETPAMLPFFYAMF